jgi:hypothetical protein
MTRMTSAPRPKVRPTRTVKALLVALAVVLVGLGARAGEAGAAGPVTARVSLAARVALLPLRGPYATHLRAALVTQLASSCAIVPVAMTDRTLRRAGRWPRGAAGWSTLARHLGNATTIAGEISSGAVWRVTLVVRRGGALVGTLAWEELEPLRLMEAVLDEAPRKITGVMLRPERSRFSRRPLRRAGGEPILTALVSATRPTRGRALGSSGGAARPR